MAGLFVVVAVVKSQVQRLAGDKGAQRRRAAAGRARRRLREALTEIDAQQGRDAAERVGAALVGLVADVTGVSEAGLTTTDAQRSLTELGVDGQLIQRLANLFEACDGARYGGSQDALHGLGAESQAVLDALLDSLREKRLLR